MRRACVIVVDKKHAVFFAVEGPGDGSLSPRTRLAQKEEVTNEGLLRLRGAEKIDSRIGGYAMSVPGPSSGGGSGSHAGQAARSGFTDTHEEEETLVVFAKDVRECLVKYIGAHKATDVIVVAGPQMLGVLRPAFGQSMPSGVRILEVRKDLSGHGTTDIHDALVREEVLPGRRPAAMEFNANP